MLPRSLRWQIQIWHGGLLFILVVTVLVAFYDYERRVRIARIDAELTGPVVALLPRFIRLPGEAGAEGPRGRGPDRPDRPTRPTPTQGSPDDLVRGLEESGHYVYHARPNGTVNYVSPGAPEIPPIDKKLTENQARGAMRGRWNASNRELVSISPRGEIVLLGLRENRIAADLREFVLRLALLGTVVIGAGLLGGYFIANRAIRPIRAIGDAALRIADGHWDQRIPACEAPVEVEQLRAVLNGSFERLATAYDMQRRFSADASHELGTPVAIVLAQTQHALSRPRTAEEYAAALQACRRAAERMRALTHDLLDLAAYEADSATARRVECDLAEVAREALAMTAGYANSREAIVVDRLEQISARIDPLGLSQVLVNLLTNSVAHNAPGRHVALTLSRDHDHARFEIEDDGRGIPAEALPRIFDRFYKSDASRQRDETGGSGLGLSIAQRIVQLHGGTLTVANRPVGGACFTVRVPIA